LEHVLLNLGFPFPYSWLVEGHLDGFTWRRNYHGTHRREIRTHFLVINRPVSLEIETFLIAGEKSLAETRGEEIIVGLLFDGWFETIPGLISNAMVDLDHFHLWKILVDGVLTINAAIPWHERSLVFGAINQGMRCIAIG
jgi:hypothetical protein